MRALAWFLGLFCVAFVATAVFTYPAWLLLHPHFNFPFHRIGERIGMLALLAGFVLIARRLGVADRKSLGYGLPRRLFLREMGIALALGVATMLAGVGLMSALGLLEWTGAAGLETRKFTGLIVSRLLSGLAVAFIEETFLRGAMHGAIERESGTTAAIALTAVVYSATHFFGTYHIAAEHVTASSGTDLLAGTLHAFADPLRIADAFVSLAAVGVVLGTLRAVTGNIAACIGLHAGWVWVMLVVHDLSRPVRTSPWSFLLSRFDGFVGWLVTAWTILIGWALWRFYSQRARARTACARRISV